MEARIREEFPAAAVRLIESSGGVFEVTVDGDLVYSKKATGRHPEWEDVRRPLEERS